MGGGGSGSTGRTALKVCRVHSSARAPAIWEAAVAQAAPRMPRPKRVISAQSPTRFSAAANMTARKGVRESFCASSPACAP